MILIFKKKSPKYTYNVKYSKVSDKSIKGEDIAKYLSSIITSAHKGIVHIKAKIIPKDLANKYISFANNETDDILSKVASKKNIELTEDEVAQGIVAAPDEYFLVKGISKYSTEEQQFLKPFYTSTTRNLYLKSDISIIYLSVKNFGKSNIKNYPHIFKHFEPYRKELEEAKVRYGTPDKPYYFLHRERDENFFKKGPKIVGSTRTIRPSFLYTENEYYGSRAMNFIKTDRIDLKYLVGLLNSRLVYFWLKNRGKQLGDLLQIDKGPLLEIPLYVPGKTQQKQIIDLVSTIMALSKKYQAIKSKQTSETERLKRQIEETDREIDELVYKLYGLTKEEIKVVEGEK